MAGERRRRRKTPKILAYLSFLHCTSLGPKLLTRSLRAARKKSSKTEGDSSLIFLDNLTIHQHGSHPCTKTALTLKQTQREKGRVRMTSNMEMLVRTPPHRLMPVSSSSAEYLNITRGKFLLLPSHLL